MLFNEYGVVTVSILLCQKRNTTELFMCVGFFFFQILCNHLNLDSGNHTATTFVSWSTDAPARDVELGSGLESDLVLTCTCVGLV